MRRKVGRVSTCVKRKSSWTCVRKLKEKGNEGVRCNALDKEDSGVKPMEELDDSDPSLAGKVHQFVTYVTRGRMSVLLGNIHMSA